MKLFSSICYYYYFYLSCCISSSSRISKNSIKKKGTFIHENNNNNNNNNNNFNNDKCSLIPKPKNQAQEDYLLHLHNPTINIIAAVGSAGTVGRSNPAPPGKASRPSAAENSRIGPGRIYRRGPGSAPDRARCPCPPRCGGRRPRCRPPPSAAGR